MVDDQDLERALNLAYEIAEDLEESEIVGFLKDGQYRVDSQYDDWTRSQRRQLGISFTNRKSASPQTVTAVKSFLKTHAVPLLGLTGNHGMGWGTERISSISLNLGGKEKNSWDEPTEIQGVEQLNESQIASGNIYPTEQGVVFISHSAKDSAFASQLGLYLKAFGLTSFVAHDDIRGGERWDDAILERLQETSVFIACVNQNFQNSTYCHQETGYAIAKSRAQHDMGMDSDVKVIPLKLGDQNPEGMITNIQAINIPKARLGGEQLANIVRQIS